jgi:hypothetical protein
MAPLALIALVAAPLLLFNLSATNRAHDRCGV